MRLDEQEIPAGASPAGGVKSRSNTGETPLPSSARIPTLDHLLIEAAIQCPEADALTGEFGSLSYADLLIRAQNIALVLKRRGVGPGHFIGIAMEQSPVTITAILGVVLVGAAYVPLGSQLLTAAALWRARGRGVEIVLCDGSLANATGRSSCGHWRALGTVLDASRMEQETMPSSSEVKMLAISAGSAAALLIEIPPVRAVGRPEPLDVSVSHRCIANLASSEAIMEFGAGEIFLLPASTSARTGLFELWACLLHGSTLAVAPARSMEPTAYAEWIGRQNVSVLCLTASSVHEYIDRAPQIFSKLRHLIIESDGRNGAISPHRVEWLANRYPQLRVVNVYGGQGIAGYATAFRIPAGYKVQATIPIGQPLEGSQAYLLDEKLEPVRRGEIGELSFSGDCVGASEDVLSDTSSRFEIDLYRTGERARLRADGLLELHGHIQPQLLAVSHARIFQAADVEAMVSGQQKVHEAAVIEDKGRDGRQQFVAFVAMEKEADTARQTERHGTRDQLEDSLRTALPEDAMPAAVRYVEELPHDADGDVDRYELQQRWKKENEQSIQTERLQQDTLDQVRSLWLRLLRRSSVGYEEDFFEAGGTQVQMIRMHAELNRRFPGAITMAQLSVLRTIHQIYQHLTLYLASERPSSFARRGA